LAVIICKPDIKSVRAVLAELFRNYGVPRFIQCDNGVPFIAVRARAGLTSLSAWWISLGIALMRSRMGCPQDNGGHERMHRDVRADVQSTPAANIVAQQRALDKWRHQFNSVRPHEALKGKTPSAIYTVPTKRKFTRKTAVYPIDRELVFVSSKGIVRFRGTSYFLSLAVAGCILPTKCKLHKNQHESTHLLKSVNDVLSFSFCTRVARFFALCLACGAKV
jgi:putative transposase